MAKKEVKSLLRDVSVEPEKPQTLVTPVEQMKIDELTLLRMTRYMEKERAARAEIEIAGVRLNNMFQRWLSDNAEARQANARLMTLQNEQAEAQKKYQEIVAEIGKQFKINMAEFSFDDETGVLHPLTSPALPEPNGAPVPEK